MAGEQEAQRRHLCAEGLRQCQHDPTDQRAPHRAGAADHRGLEGEEQLRRAGIGVEGATHAEGGAGEADCEQSDCRRNGRRHARVDADESGGVGVFRGGPDGAAIAREAQEELQATEHDDGEDEGADGELADIDVTGQRDRVVAQGADEIAQRAGVGAEQFEQNVVDDNSEPEGCKDGHELSGLHRTVEDEALQQEADHRHQR